MTPDLSYEYCCTELYLVGGTEKKKGEDNKCGMEKTSLRTTTVTEDTAMPCAIVLDTSDTIRTPATTQIHIYLVYTLKQRNERQENKQKQRASPRTGSPPAKTNIFHTPCTYICT